MLNNRVNIITTLLLTLLLSHQAQADIYFYIDIDGDQHFSQYKVDENYQLLLRNKNNKSPGTFKNWQENNSSGNESQISNNKKLQKRYHPLVLQAAIKYHLEPAFIHAVITAESSYQYDAVSEKGAMGLMQLMPLTAKRFGVDDPFDAKQSIRGGTEYLYHLLKEFKTKKLALAAYNAGEGTVRRYNKQIPPYPETQKYVSKVMDFYRYYRNNL